MELHVHQNGICFGLVPLRSRDLGLCSEEFNMASVTGPSRITELPNELTTDIDTCSPVGIVRTLRQSDAQLFAGWGSYASIGDTAMLEKIDRLANKTATLLKENLNGANNVFVFTGCGTSGRIAWACSRSFNNLLSQFGLKSCFQYLIAGGDQALIVGKELPEDDPPQGAKDLQDITQGADQVVLFGITCGLSAPYVAGQIDYSMYQPNYTSVLVGFNPVQLARSAPIEKWHKNCKDTFLELEKLELESGRGVILNPIVGPEPITGSSRMKGGSMTAILLDIILITALSRTFNISIHKLISSAKLENGLENTLSRELNSETVASNGSFLPGETVSSLSQSRLEVATIVDAFAATYNAAYRPVEGIASLLQMAADSLRHPDGHLYYLGTDLFGVLGFIDSSEMVSTYGSSPHEVRGFITRGWTACQNREGDLSGLGQLYSISLDDFERDILPILREHDSVIWFDCKVDTSASKSDETQLHTMVDKVLSSQASCGVIVLSQDREHAQSTYSSDPRYKAVVHTVLPHFSVLSQEPLFAGFALKLILNAISTGANIMKGKVFCNTMINLTVANDKLFYRSIGIIRGLSGVDEESAKTVLLQSIYRDDDITKYSSYPVSMHITAATKQEMVVPFATIMASRRCSAAEATSIIANAKSLRTLIQSKK